MSLLSYQQKTHRVFNKFFSSFLKDLKEVNDDLRKNVKANYKVIDKTSPDYCVFFKENMIEHVQSFIDDTIDTDLKDKYVCNGIVLGDVLAGIASKSVEEQNIIKNYLYVLVLFAYMSTLDGEEALFTQVVSVLSSIQEGNITAYMEGKESILEDDVKSLLEKIREFGIPPQAPKIDESPDPASLFSMLGNSKIADLAKEISQDIDVSSLKTENPEDMIKNMLDFNSGNNVLGNIIQKVSSSLNNKISSGELKQEDLLGEAMSMMNMFGGSGGSSGGNPFASNPFFAQMMKGMKSGKATVRPDVVRKQDARSRLRKKLEARSQEQT
jgi:hypothetical protein